MSSAALAVAGVTSTGALGALFGRIIEIARSRKSSQTQSKEKMQHDNERVEIPENRIASGMASSSQGAVG
jgi:hypothetical protein